MRNLIVYIVLAYVFTACEEVVLKPYSGKDVIQFYSKDYDKKPKKEFFWSAALDPEGEFDTCWISVQTVGHASDVARKIKIVQETAIGVDLIYDMVGNVVDSVLYIIQNQAIVKRHFVSFDDPGLQHLLVIPANTYQIDIPIVMKKDPEVRKKQTLMIRLVDTEDVKVGDPYFSGCLITIE